MERYQQAYPLLVSTNSSLCCARKRCVLQARPCHCCNQSHSLSLCLFVMWGKASALVKPQSTCLVVLAPSFSHACSNYYSLTAATSPMAYTPSVVEESLSSTIILPALSTFIPALDRPRLAVTALRPVDNNNYTLDTHFLTCRKEHSVPLVLQYQYVMEFNSNGSNTCCSCPVSRFL